MRIISGSLKGRKFPGGVPPTTRPTADSGRETIFNILGNYLAFEEMRIADICAGTGALGFEALSRGAAHCTFVEKNRKAVEFIRHTAELFGIPKEEYSIEAADAVKFLQRHTRENSFDLILTDPPYQAKLVNPILEMIVQNSLLAPGGVFMAEHELHEVIAVPEGWEKLTERKWGTTVVDFIQRPEIS